VEEAGLYDATETMLLARTRALPDARRRVGLVGHNPGLGELATALTGSGAEPEMRRLAAKYPTGAIAALDFSVHRWQDVERKSAMLALYLTPAELEADAD
jgi:phosphohistidine phosphatase